MSAPRITSLALGGLVTTPNPSGVVPEGAARVFTNVRAIGPNLAGAVRAPAVDAQGGVNGNEILKISPLKSGKYASIQFDGITNFAHYGENQTANLYTLPSGALSTGGLDALYDRNGFINPMIARDRWFTNTRAGVLVLDTLTPSTGADRTLRHAALPQPEISGVDTTAGQAWPATNLIATYKAVFVRESSDGYVLTSPDSVGFRLLNTSGATKDGIVSVRWALSDDLKVGDYVELYRSAGLAAGTYDTDPGDDCFLVLRYALTSADIAAKLVILTDRVPFGASPGYATPGALIYTAATQQTAAGANFQPPVCRTTCAWSNYALYGNVSEAPTWKLDVPATWGALTTAYDRLNGIGQRAGAGTITVGSPTVTGVSAADMVGVKVGQWFDRSSGLTNFTSNARVISTTSSSFTMNENAASSGAAWLLEDTLQISNVDYKCGTASRLALNIALTGTYELSSSSTLVGDAFSNLATDATLTIRPARHTNTTPGVVFTLRATNGANYGPVLPEYTASAIGVNRTEQPNMIRVSKYNQPEAVPYTNEIRVGLGAIIAMQPTTDCVLVACTDGLFRVTGVEGQWRSDPIDQTLIIAGPQACDTLYDKLIAYTNRGLLSYSTAEGMKLLSKGVVEDLLPGAAYQASRFPIVVADETREEATIVLKASSSPINDATIYVYSATYNKFSKLDLSTIATNAQRITALAMRRDTATAGQLPFPLFGQYISGVAQPVVWRDDSLSNTLPMMIVLQRFGDPTTLKQYVDCSWLFNIEAASVVEVVGSWNGIADGSRAFAKATRVDARATLGIPRSDALRASIEPGCTIASVSVDVKLLGISLRVVPKTTQQETR